MHNIKSEASYPCSQAVKALRDFVMSFEEPGAREGEFFCSLSIMEDALFTVRSQKKSGKAKFKILSEMTYEP